MQCLIATVSPNINDQSLHLESSLYGPITLVLTGLLAARQHFMVKPQAGLR
jgi:hypothetical protein